MKIWIYDISNLRTHQPEIDILFFCKKNLVRAAFPWKTRSFYRCFLVRVPFPRKTEAVYHATFLRKTEVF